MNLILTPFLAFIISFLIFPVLIKVVTKWELYDSIKEHKIHETFTPSAGGLAIYAGILLALSIGLPFQQWVQLKYFFISISLMFIIGIRDDVLGLSPVKKLVSQLLPIFILVVFGAVSIEAPIFSIQLGGYPYGINLILTTIAIVLITNSYNLIDGLDGLAGSIGVICMLFFGIWFYLVDSYFLSLIAFCVVGSLLAFLIFNWQPSKIFMGDTGALLIGFLLSYYSIQFLNTNFKLDAEHFMKFDSSLGTLICILAIPVFDTSRVVVLRLRKGRSPFRADKNHVHHQFLSLGIDHATSVGFLMLINLLFIGMAFVCKNQSDIVIAFLFIVICLAFNFSLKKMQSNVKAKQ